MQPCYLRWSVASHSAQRIPVTHIDLDATIRKRIALLSHDFVHPTTRARVHCFMQNILRWRAWSSINWDTYRQHALNTMHASEPDNIRNACCTEQRCALQWEMPTKGFLLNALLNRYFASMGSFQLTLSRSAISKKSWAYSFLFNC